MLFPGYSDTEIIIAWIFNKEHPADLPVFSLQELRDEPLISDLEPRWREIAAKVSKLTDDAQSQMAASYRKQFKEIIAPNAHDTSMFGSTRGPRSDVTPTGKISRGWEPKGSDKE
jgi:hypothetical protein